jgi:hypothetical protein
MMAFANNYVVSVLVNGKPQREFSSDGKRAVTLPFGSEYKIRIKNQSYKKALINVTIDGASIFSAGQQLILRGQESIDLERFVDNLSEGRKFKFVSKDQAAVEGHFDPTSSEMGLLKVEFVPELEWPSLIRGGNVTLGQGGLLGGGLSSARRIMVNNTGPFDQTFAAALPDSSFQAGAAQCSTNASIVGNAQDLGVTAQNSVGGTVEGGNSNQNFGVSNDFNLWEWGKKTTIDIQMKGPGAEPMAVDFGFTGLPKLIKKGGQEYSIQSVMTTTDGSVTVVYK